ncbi:DUF4190 domain-containing protein [uncultured Rothia sp.]|uniref:DUF4190 domain-containing protein n=1 Tax=uncultured Rothia sp. TaxID=316088 RepID=UPI0028D02C64|nr:DUF4190 domain-containing protein [uncultured Rothia sp.]
MSRNPWGSDSYDYNPDYNHLNEQYDQNSQYGQYGQGSYGQYGQSSYDQYPYDQYSQGSYGQDFYGQNQYDPYGYQYDQPMMVPAGFLQKTPEQFFGEKAAQTSTVLGVIGLICIVTLNWWLLGLPSLILGVIGIFKANEAERYGAVASAGRILNWINVAVGGIFLVLFGGALLLALMLALSDSAANSELVDAAKMLALL